MTTLTLAMASFGWLTACAACAQNISQGIKEDKESSYLVNGPGLKSDTQSSVHSGNGLLLKGVEAFDMARGASTEMARDDTDHQSSIAADTSYRSSDQSKRAQLPQFGIRDNQPQASLYQPLGKHTAIFGSFGLQPLSGFGMPASYMQRSEFDNPSTSFSSDWLDSSKSSSRIFTVGYSWRALRLEQTATNTRTEQGEGIAKLQLPQLVSRSTKLSYLASPNWKFQLRRGNQSGLDQFMPDSQYLRRTALSVTYDRPFEEGRWQTTLAWGRSVRAYQEPTFGYLIESLLQFSKSQGVFGRIEQVSSDDLVMKDETAGRQLFKLNKITVGYYQDVKMSSSFHLDVGALASRHLTPSSMTPYYGNNPTSYMMFVRFKLQ